MNNKIALVTDTHFGVRKNSPTMLEYQLDFFQKVFFPIIDKLKIETIIHLGDFFHHRRNIDFFILEQVKERFLKEVKKRNLKLIIIVGNHDSYTLNSNDLNSVNVLMKDYGFIVLDKPQTIKINDIDICILPWINEENSKDSENEINNTKSKIIMGHLEIQNFNISKGHPSLKGFESKTFSRFDKVLSGHFHLKSSDKNIHYLGTPYQMTWDDHNEPKGFYILNLDNFDLKYIQNKFEIFNKIIYDGKNDEIDNKLVTNCYVKLYVKNRENLIQLEEFIKNIQKLKPLDLKIIEENELQINVDEENIVVEDIKTFIEKYVKSLKHPDNIKNEDIMNIMNELYMEANNL